MWYQDEVLCSTALRYESPGGDRPRWWYGEAVVGAGAGGDSCSSGSEGERQLAPELAGANISEPATAFVQRLRTSLPSLFFMMLCNRSSHDHVSS